MNKAAIKKQLSTLAIALSCTFPAVGSASLDLSGDLSSESIPTDNNYESDLLSSGFSTLYNSESVNVTVTAEGTINWFSLTSTADLAAEADEMSSFELDSSTIGSGGGGGPVPAYLFPGVLIGSTSVGVGTILGDGGLEAAFLPSGSGFPAILGLDEGFGVITNGATTGLTEIIFAYEDFLGFPPDSDYDDLLVLGVFEPLSTPIPEPGTYALLGSALSLATLTRKRASSLN